jgi:hypothetical protein
MKNQDFRSLDEVNIIPEMKEEDRIAGLPLVE